MFAIIDCNNFYASCERLFRPDLYQQPIIVLSNNDGCVIARSNEAKALNIKMGQAYFQIKKFCQQHHVHVFSSNYVLYGDLSARVMRVIEETWPYVEIYSIDEAFLNLSTLPSHQHQDFCEHLRTKIWRHVGIPTSIGIGPTKTLAKAANHVAKKTRHQPVFAIHQHLEWLESIAIDDIWGIGKKWAQQLKNLGIYTAGDLKRQSPSYIRKHFSLPLMQTTLELQGFACHELQTSEPKQSIVASRSFGRCQTEFTSIAEALSHHCARATQKLRQQKSKVCIMSVFIRTNPFQQHQPQYAKHCSLRLPEPTDDLRCITLYAKQGLQQIFKSGFAYHKVGVCFEQISSFQQHSLFSSQIPNNSQPFMQVLEDIQAKFGRHSIYLAAEGSQATWTMKSDQRSPAYTTSWPNLPIVKIK